MSWSDSVAAMPRIAGQHQAYFVKSLQAYKSGERSHPSMRGIAATLSDQDMADLAAYYAAPSTATAGK
jgi:cytochrome c553